MNKTFLHIPHSSTLIPGSEAGKFTADVGEELKYMTDLYTDELFDVGEDRLIFPVSRLVCDVERFRDDRNEEMAKVGMGAVYVGTHDLKRLRTVTAEEREAILKKWYDPHHLRLEAMTEERLHVFGKCLIIDCHSFSGRPLPYEMNKDRERPDVCIGTDPFHTPPELAGRLFDEFRHAGFRTEFDRPYSGCMIPIKHYRRDANVHGVMIEINRDLYLDGDFCKRKNFGAIRKEIKRIFGAVFGLGERA